MGIYASQRNDMQEFLISTSIVALAEMGDKTQLLALLLSARFRKPIPILIAILLATLINHGISAVLGQWITTVLSPEILVWVLAAALQHDKSLYTHIEQTQLNLIYNYIFYKSTSFQKVFPGLKVPRIEVC